MTIYALDGLAAELPENGDYWIAPDANVIGPVSLGEGASVRQNGRETVLLKPGEIKPWAELEFPAEAHWSERVEQKD